MAIDMILTAVERAQQLFPRADTRPKIRHCTLINDGLVKRIKALDAIPALCTTYAYNSDKFVFYGEDLMKRCMAFRSLLDAGVQVVAGSDFSPGPFAPLMGIQGMVTRRICSGIRGGRLPTVPRARAPFADAGIPCRMFACRTPVPQPFTLQCSIHHAAART